MPPGPKRVGNKREANDAGLFRTKRVRNEAEFEEYLNAARLEANLIEDYCNNNKTSKGANPTTSSNAAQIHAETNITTSSNTTRISIETNHITNSTTTQISIETNSTTTSNATQISIETNSTTTSNATQISIETNSTTNSNTAPISASNKDPNIIEELQDDISTQPDTPSDRESISSETLGDAPYNSYEFTIL